MQREQNDTINGSWASHDIQDFNDTATQTQPKTQEGHMGQVSKFEQQNKSE